MEDTMKYYAAIIISMIIWGSVGIFTRYANQPPQVIVFFRVLSACLVLSPFMFKAEGRKTGKVNYGFLVLSGIFLSLNWLFFFKAVQTTTIAKATLSYYTAPILVTILSPLLLKEKLERRTVFSIILAFSGICLIILFPLSGITSGDNVGILYGLAAAFFYSLVTISAKHLSGVSPVKLTFFQTFISAIIFLPFIIGRVNFDIGSILIMCSIGILHTSIALTLYFYGVKGIKVQHTGVLSYIDPLSAVLFGLVAFGEIPSIFIIAGGVLILVGSFIILKRAV
jgi:RarD protein